ncbi:TonB-dependent receptor [Pelagerythrobacter sp.]|uniref:TonB-dependent receptor n=1 Tax=Pelagerythrobacter sp. TaxID=2800702 RepID=UPI0035B2C46D
MRPLACLAIAVAAVAPAAAHAQRVAIDAPAGAAGDAAIAIARQTGTSIVIADARTARRNVPRLRGTMDAAQAVRRLARAAGGRAVPAGPSAWRIVAEPRQARRAPRAAPPPTARPPTLAAPALPAPPIVVIASKRDTPRGEFPGQVSMIDGETLEFGGIGGTEKIVQRVATVSSTYLGSGRNKLFIRGIADSSFTGPTQATVGQYLGDLRLSYNAPDPDLRLSDLERVEVLEGPQGTLYGAGSLGGIIRLVPNAPQPGVTSVSGAIGGELVQHGEPGADANATFNVPLAPDGAALRVTIDAASRGGYIDKPALDRTDVNRTDILGGRAMVRVEVAPEWTVDLVGLGQSTRSVDSQYADRGGDPLTSSASVREGSRADYLHGQFVVSGRIGDVRLRSTTGVASQDLQERYDATPPGGPDRLFVQDNDTRMIANETRLWQPLGERFGWLAGISFTDNDTRLTRSLGTPDSQMSATGVRNTVTEATAYGEASLRVAEHLVATAGARYTRSRLGGAGEDVPLALAAARAEITASRTETAFLPSASLLAQVAPDTALYLRYQEGFRPGGLAIEGEFVRRFRSDHATTFEFGARHGTPGFGPFDLSASLSHTRWSDIQADFIDDLGLPSTANIGDGRVWTASVSGGVEVLPHFRLNGGLTYNDSRVDEPRFLLLARATHVPNIAGVAARLGADYRTWLDSGLELRATGWASYVGKSRLGIGPELGDLQGDYLDSGMVVRLGGERMGVTLSLVNLADVKGNRFALGTPFAMGRDQVTPLQPRTIRLGLDARF